MSKRDSLGDRMKRYEATSRHTIQPRTPTIIRVDGKAFHTFTKRFDFPFSEAFHIHMVSATIALFLEVQNARVAYTQSDEISILLNDWEQHETQQWFGGVLQKMCSVAASTATAAFLYDYLLHSDNPDEFRGGPGMLPRFDARVFQMPKEEVNNYFLWRQQDAARNSVQMLGRSKFSHKQLHRKNVSEIQDMLMAEFGINWNDLDTWKKRGCCVRRSSESYRSSEQIIVDAEIPLFSADRNYIAQHLTTEAA